MESRRGTPTATAFAKNLPTGAGFNGRSVYDGVFGVQRKGGRSLMEDYGEIFGGSGGSIPVLDVPELNESKMKVDVRSSQLDYSKVFGGFAEFDFAVSLEELIANPKSEKKASTKTRSISENLIHSNLQEENEVPHQSFDGVKKVKMSFNKTNPGSENGATGTVHVAKLHEVPGYSYVIDELNQDDKPKPVSPASREIRPTMNFSDGMKEGRHTRRTMSDLPPGYDYKQSSNGDHGSRNISSSKSSPQNGVFSSPQVGLGKRNSPEVLRASRLPNNSGGDSKCNSSEFGAFMNRCSGDAADLSSSPNLDGEVDENSDAATSAAAVKKAIEEAQSRINMAIELMERKKEGQMKPTFGGLKVKKKMKNKGTAEEKTFRGKEARDMDDQFHVSSPIKQDTMEPTQVAPDNVDTTVIVNEADGETHEENFSSFQTDHRDGETEESISAPQGEEVKNVMQSMDECKPEEKECDENQVEYSTKVEATEESSKDVLGGELDRVSGLPDVPESRDELKLAEEVRGEKQDNKTKQIFSRWWGKIEEMLGVSTDLEASGGKPNKLEEPTDSRQGFEVEEKKEDISSERSEDSKKCEDNEEKQNEVLNREGFPESNDLPETEENQTVTEDIPKQEECGKEYEEASEMVELEEELKESCREGENDEKHDVCSRDYVEKPSDEFVEMETDEEEVNDFHYWEENRKKHEDDGESGGNEGEGENVVDEANEIKEAEEIQEGISGQENTERIQEHANQSVEGEKSGDAEEIPRGNSEWVDSETIEQQTDQCSYSETTEDTEEDLNCLGDVDDSAENAHQQVEVENLVKSGEPCRHEHLEDVEMLPKLVVHRENVVIEELTEECVEVRQSGRGSVAVEEMLPKLVVHRENLVIKELAEEFVEVGQYGRESEAVEVNNFAEYAEVFGASGLAEGISELDEIQKQMESERDALPIDRNGIKVDVKDLRFEQLQQNQPEKESEMFCNAETHIEESTCELEEDIPDFEEVKVTIDQENKCSPESRDGVRLLDNWVGTQTDLPPCTFDGKEETAGIAPKEAITNQGTEGYEENHYETLTKIRRKSKAISQKKMDLKQEEQRKRDEAKQRERERRKERIAVERAVREARERAFADACERAEKAAAEKANVEARRRARWEKPSADANDKASMEAKLKAERAAVERATAEARQRALEKTFSEKASFKDSHLNASDLPASSRYTSSSNNGVTHVSERVDGEPAQRGKAISEREQRTEERAAKALAEKNMRDLLAQKEQAERNRLAETLDAEVKRWSKGKEGNLRALLSTLQYILGPESGWQPIPLTELIATTAVKKAYRKATLYVHPDKLQQRGASIQQKYTCEKVFDLLKAAWNRFSAEER